MVTPATSMPASAASSRSILRSSGTANGSMTTGVVYVAVTRATGASRTRLTVLRADARAMRTASRAASSRPAASVRWVPQKPHAPSTSTRMPHPSSSNWLTLLTRPFLTVTDWMVRCTTRQSAYVAPAASAASRSRSAMSRMAAHLRGGLRLRVDRRQVVRVAGVLGDQRLANLGHRLLRDLGGQRPLQLAGEVTCSQVAVAVVDELGAHLRADRPRRSGSGCGTGSHSAG